MSFVQDDVTLLISLIVFVFWQSSNRSSGSGRSGKNRLWYDRNRKHVSGGAIPGIAFRYIWNIIYGLVVASFYIYFREFQDTRFYLANTVLFIVNIMLNKWWSVEFFDNEDTMTSLFIAVCMFLTGLAISILQGMDEAWISVGLWLPYVLWVGFAVILNWQWNKKGLPTVTDGRALKNERNSTLPGPQGPVPKQQQPVSEPTLGTPNIVQQQHNIHNRHITQSASQPRNQYGPLVSFGIPETMKQSGHRHQLN